MCPSESMYRRPWVVASVVAMREGCPVTKWLAMLTALRWRNPLMRKL